MVKSDMGRFVTASPWNSPPREVTEENRYLLPEDQEDACTTNAVFPEVFVDEVTEPLLAYLLPFSLPPLCTKKSGPVTMSYSNT